MQPGKPVERRDVSPVAQEECVQNRAVLQFTEWHWALSSYVVYLSSESCQVF